MSLLKIFSWIKNCWLCVRKLYTGADSRFRPGEGGGARILGRKILSKFWNQKFENRYKIFARMEKKPKIRSKTSKNRNNTSTGRNLTLISPPLNPPVSVAVGFYGFYINESVFFSRGSGSVQPLAGYTTLFYSLHTSLVVLRWTTLAPFFLSRCRNSENGPMALIFDGSSATYCARVKENRS